MSTHLYPLASFPDPTNVSLDVLIHDIEASTISVQLDKAQTQINDVGNPPISTFVAVFKAQISASELQVLDGIVGNHDANSLPQSAMPVDISGSVSTAGGVVGLPVLRASIQPQTLNYEMCNRDIKLRTSVIGNGSFEDYKVDLVSGDFRLKDWGEVVVVGVYKYKVPGDPLQGYEACVDQLDADINAALTVWDFHPNDQTLAKNPIKWDIRGGYLYIDPTIQQSERHELYAIAAPNIPSSFGGQVRLFDGYLAAFAGEFQVAAIDPTARSLDPTTSPEASKFRIYCYYPAGLKKEHILRLITYRPSGTS